MTPSLRAVLTGLIDYAGLFPPAKLPLAEALTLHRRYQAHRDAWMLGRFVCPAARLGELAQHGLLLTDGPALVVSALGRGSAAADGFRPALDADLFEIVAARERHRERVVIDVLEVKLPADALADPAKLDGLLANAAETLRAADLAVFFEAPLGDAGVLGRLLGRLAGLGLPRVGFKARTGGLEPTAFPTTRELAGAVDACVHAGVPFKATAGLHHPLPRFDAGVRARMHGFVNLFAAGVLASEARVGPEALREVLEIERPEAFRFDADGLRVGPFAVCADAIAKARREACLSFGSCSFDEPRDDLKSLGWM